MASPPALFDSIYREDRPRRPRTWPKMPEGRAAEKSPTFPPQQERTTSLSRRIVEAIFKVLITFVTITHGRAYGRSTRAPIFELAKLEADDRAEVERQLRVWLKHKKSEAQYVQVAVSPNPTFNLELIS